MKHPKDWGITMKFRMIFAGLAFIFANSAWAEDFVMVAMGDSITRAMDAEHLFDNPEYSWATGDKKNFPSHRKFIETTFSRTVRTRNVSKSGASTGDLTRQLGELQKETKVDYVTILLGANDICGWSDDFEKDLVNYKNRMTSAVKTILGKYSNAKILIGAIPDMYRLWELAHVQPKCVNVWNQYGICQDLLATNLTEADRQRFMLRWSGVNEALADISKEFTDNVKFVSELSSGTFGNEHISSIDCFHPSVEGQKFFSEIAWTHGFWAE